MKFIIAAVILLFAIVITMSLLSNKRETKKRDATELKLRHEGELRSAAASKMAEFKVSKSSMTIENGAVRIEGIADSPETRRLVSESINSIEGLSLKETDNNLTVNGYLSGEKSSGVFTLTGHINDSEALVSKLADLESFPVVKGGGLTEAHYYVESEEAHKPEFKSWLTDYMRPAGNRSFLLKGNTLTLEGETTLEIETSWMKSLRALELIPISKLTSYPSEINFPSYSYQSSDTLSPDELEVLNRELSMAKVIFGSGLSQLDSRQVFKVDIVSSVMNATGSRAKFVIGGHIDSTGDVDANRALSSKRVKSVLKLLQERGVNTDELEVVTFDPTEAGRSVEIRVK